jgi:ABC-type bacteriocin/lantibiotic exporter with double-glycine peptidase domain
MASKNQSISHGIAQVTVLKSLLPYLWIDDWHLRIRIFFSLFFVLITILINLCIPLALKAVIQLLTHPAQAVFAQAMILLISYGALWTFAQITVQMREIVMFRTMERGIRLLSMAIFKHLHTLSMRFHLERRTGAITNAIERAQHSLPDIFWGVCLFVVPTALEIIMATLILVYFY